VTNDDDDDDDDAEQVGTEYRICAWCSQSQQFAFYQKKMKKRGRVADLETTPQLSTNDERAA
jgi:hypothetical protein